MTLVQRLPNVVQTSMTFGQHWVDIVKTSNVHWGVSSSSDQYLALSNTDSLFSYISKILGWVCGLITTMAVWMRDSCSIYTLLSTVELQWLEHLWNHDKKVRDRERSS